MAWRGTVSAGGMLVMAWVAVGLAGCLGGDGRQAVQGQVTLDGQPLQKGAISFRPAPGTAANTSGGAITGGRYFLPATQGLQPGQYTVGVQTYRETGRILEDPQLGKIPELVPVKFHKSDTLAATITRGTNEIDFHLTTQK
jgi:hypothetical protein